MPAPASLAAQLNAALARVPDDLLLRFGGRAMPCKVGGMRVVASDAIPPDTVLLAQKPFTSGGASVVIRGLQWRDE